MRLSEMIEDTTTFNDSLQVVLYHGTHSGYRESFKDGIGIPATLGDKTETDTDFGPGFYMTSFSWQAIHWAKARARADSEQPILIMVKVSLRKLRRFLPERILLIDEYNALWASTIRMGRAGQPLPYDAICGRCADGNVNNFSEQDWLENDCKLAKLLAPSGNEARHHYEQIWFGTTEAIKQCLTNFVIMDV